MKAPTKKRAGLLLSIEMMSMTKNRAGWFFLGIAAWEK
jgi:hypothetical protein